MTYIGQQWVKPLVYAPEDAVWANNNKAVIVDKGTYYECVEVIVPEPTLEELKNNKISEIDKKCSDKIFSGFTYTYQGTPLHFSYDSFDQQNFADTANASLLATISNKTEGVFVEWNGYTVEGGTLVRITLNPQEFLSLYMDGALAHKATVMEQAGVYKESVREATTKEEVEGIEVIF